MNDALKHTAGTGGVAAAVLGSVFHQPKLLADIHNSRRRIGGADANWNLGWTAMKTIHQLFWSIVLFLLVCFIALATHAATIHFTRSPSPSDTNGSGCYILSGMQINGTLTALTNIPAGQTNAWVVATNSALVTAQFSTMNVTSVICQPFFVDIAKWGPAAPSQLGALPPGP